MSIQTPTTTHTYAHIFLSTLKYFKKYNETPSCTRITLIKTLNVIIILIVRKKTNCIALLCVYFLDLNVSLGNMSALRSVLIHVTEFPILPTHCIRFIGLILANIFRTFQRTDVILSLFANSSF